VIGWNGHLKERRLFESSVAERMGEPLDPRAAEHLGECLACRQRFAEVADFLDVTWSAAEAEVDAAFPAERLRAQQQQIARRLEHLTQSARVISFPGREARRMPAPSTRIAPRWIASAAAAGLFVGVGVGVFFNPRTAVAPTTVVAPIAPAPAPAAPQPADPVAAPALAGNLASPEAADAGSTANSFDSDDLIDFLTALSLEHPFAPELVGLDALTPQAREASYLIR
jgi:hypothetical protein